MVNRDYIKKELKRLFKSMDFISKRFLADEIHGLCALYCDGRG
ncbi:MAG: hypothetical protein QMD01_00090 [Thermodesulfovibrionales bacterium]|nr:hypothetical protein [Thermodesulfovibrionales bacterium]